MGIAKLKIDLEAVHHNFLYYKSQINRKTKIMVVSKASSYGNGDLEIVKLLESKNVDYLAVALTEEGVFFRENGIQSKTLIFLTDKQDFPQIVKFNLEPSIYSIELLDAFLTYLRKHNINNYPIHLKFDTGMNRLGFKNEDINRVLMLSDEKRVEVISVFSHLLASEDCNKDEITQSQIARFETVKKQIEDKFEHKILFHILNTRGITRFGGSQFDMVRLGIGLYGYSGLKRDDLVPVSKFFADIIQIKNVQPKELIGYGGGNEQNEEKTIAVLSVGYADGLWRTLGNGAGKVWVMDTFCPFIGNICMDISMIDVTDVKCKVGDEVEIFGDHISLDQIAESMDTIPYEVFTSISKRVKRVFIH